MLDDLLGWYPCHNPERPLDANTRFHVGCDPCAVAYEAQQHPPRPGQFDGWHRRWSTDVLDAMRAGDIDAVREAMAAQ